jgi:nucleotide-binding universal stress UspA family protein
MTLFQHILVPVDFGDAMQAGIDVAVGLAHKLDARITLVHAFDITPFAAMTPFAPPIDLEPLIASSERELSKVAAKVRAEWPQTETVLRRGSPCEAILEVGRARGCDLIVIATHGRRGVARVLLGSVTEKVVRTSLIPVLTVHPGRLAERTTSAA